MLYIYFILLNLILFVHLNFYIKYIFKKKKLNIILFINIYIYF